MVDRSWFRIAHGMTRLVLLIGPLAVKLPRWRGVYGWSYGLLANCHEAARWRANRHPQLARVFWAAPGGGLLVTRRYRLYADLDRRAIEVALPFGGVDSKPGNVALDRGLLVLLDYGNEGWEAAESR